MDPSECWPTLSNPEGHTWPIFPYPDGTRTTQTFDMTGENAANCNKILEARVRIELTYKGFADLSLTTWVPRHLLHYKALNEHIGHSIV